MKTRHPLGLHIQVLLSRPDILFKLITYPPRIAFLFVRMKILDARLSLRDWIREKRKK